MVDTLRLPFETHLRAHALFCASRFVKTCEVRAVLLTSALYFVLSVRIYCFASNDVACLASLRTPMCTNVLFPCRPFMDVLPLSEPSAAKRVWQSEAPYYESPIATVLNEQAAAPAVSLDDLSMLLSRETTRDPPQIFVANFSEVCTYLRTRQKRLTFFDI
jgi:hypothetical protein